MRSQTLPNLPGQVVPFPARQGDDVLSTVLDNLAQGVLMFDADFHLVFFNRRFFQLYGLSRDIAKPGCSIQDLIRHGVKVGGVSNDHEEHLVNFLERAAEGEDFGSMENLPDGRTFSIMCKPIADGGWLVSYQDVTEQQRAQDRIAHMARHDALTDLPNRVLLRERLEHELKRVKRGECLAVLCLDLDHFKSVNDTLGHPIGDELLKRVADRLRACTREPDTVVRMGGDEFAIIMTDLQDPSNAAVLSRRIQESISKPYQIDGHQIVSTISIGISMAPVDGLDPDILLKNADMALYGAKTDGRGTYRFFEQEMDARMQERRKLEMDLRKALANKEFELYYQPLVTLKGSEITGLEALLRWNHPKRGMISPADFIPIAEETGLIIPIGEWVLMTACREIANWPAPIKVAVNVSPAQLKHRHFIRSVTSALEASGAPADRLQLEITETVLMQNTFANLQSLHALRELGVQIALDDFGTGYSSLSYLRTFPFDKIKIDRSFIHDLYKGAEPLAIVHAVTGLANNLKITSTAEGVETAEQLETLHSIGCVEMQGYLFSAPKTGQGDERVPRGACKENGGRRLAQSRRLGVRVHPA
jgi:diguanylate cyclase (GGDEF)-like protein